MMHESKASWWWQGHRNGLMASIVCGRPAHVQYWLSGSPMTTSTDPRQLLFFFCFSSYLDLRQCIESQRYAVSRACLVFIMRCNISLQKWNKILSHTKWHFFTWFTNCFHSLPAVEVAVAQHKGPQLIKSGLNRWKKVGETGGESKENRGVKTLRRNSFMALW